MSISVVGAVIDNLELLKGGGLSWDACGFLYSRQLCAAVITQEDEH